MPGALLPAEVKHRFTKLCDDADVFVSVSHPLRAVAPWYVATDSANRQKRRLTWQQRHDLNALPAKAEVRIEFCTDRNLSPLLTRSLPEDGISLRASGG